MSEPKITTTDLPSPTTGLMAALARATRDTRWGPFPDPIAEQVLSSPSVRALDTALASHGIRGLKPLAGGASSIVLEATHPRDTVVRIGTGDLVARPQIPLMLQPTHAGQVGFLRYEVLPKVETRSITETDVRNTTKQLEALGYHWGDAATDNLGRLGPKLVIVDPGGISPAAVVTRASTPAAAAVDNSPSPYKAGKQAVVERSSMLSASIERPRERTTSNSRRR